MGDDGKIRLILAFLEQNDYIHNPAIQNAITKSKFKEERGVWGGVFLHLCASSGDRKFLKR